MENNKNMTIAEAVKKFDIRVDNGRRWLVYNDENEVWQVIERKKYAKTSTTIISTSSEEDAVYFLIN